jgi:hypothetical protein
MSGPQTFARIIKVDEKSRTVVGRACQEFPDLSGEILDYDSSKPHFAKWVQDTKKSSNGKSLGNVRAMHGKVAAGKLTGIEFNDTEKAVDVSAKIVDDGEWQKVMEGVYTGFSIGGKYLKKWDDDKHKGHQRYTAGPTELSLVDKPCIPTATFFEINKADGTVLQKAFQPQGGEGEGGPAKGDEEGTEAGEERKDEADGDSSQSGDGSSEGSEGGGDDTDADDDAAGKAAGGDELSEETEVEGSTEDILEFAKTVNAAGLTMPEVNKLLGFAFAGDWGQASDILAEKGVFADPENRRFPLNSAAQVKAAWYYANLSTVAEKYEGNAHGEVKKRILAAWKDQVADEEPPVPDFASTEVKKAAGELAVSALTPNLSRVAGELSRLAASAEYEYAKAFAGSAVQDFCDAAARMVKALEGVSGAEAPEELQKAFPTTGEPLSKAAPAATDDMQKALDDALAKATAPLLERIKKLESQPAPAKVSLFAVTKGGIPVGEDQNTQVDPVRTPTGEVDEAATLIKGVHRSGGKPAFFTK